MGKRRDLADLIASARRALDLSQGALGTKVGVSAQQVSRWERGLQLPHTRQLPALGAALRLELEELLMLVVDASHEEAKTARGERDFLVSRHLDFLDKIAGQMNEIVTILEGHSLQLGELRARLLRDGKSPDAGG